MSDCYFKIEQRNPEPGMTMEHGPLRNRVYCELKKFGDVLELSGRAFRNRNCRVFEFTPSNLKGSALNVVQEALPDFRVTQLYLDEIIRRA